MGSEHSTRWKSAAVMLGVILVVGLIDNIFLTWAFLGVVGFFAVTEACKLWGINNCSNSLIISAIIWIVALFLNNPINLIFIAIMALAAKLAYDKSIDKKEFLTIFYPIASMLFIWALYLVVGMKALVWLLVIVALSDVGAYYTGKNFGKTPFSPTSPKKTLEGVFGGVAMATLFGAITISSSSDIGFFTALLIALLTAISAVFGDLFESYLKREAGVKDSGDIIPGHGGVLDRVDGYLFAGVMLYILLTL